MFETIQCLFRDHVWQGWEWDSQLGLEHRACTRCRRRKTRRCQHEGQLIFLKESERQSVHYDGAFICYQNYLDKLYRCPRCGGEVTETVPTDLQCASALEGRSVYLTAIRADPCIAVRDMVAEFVQWSGGSVGSTLQDAVRLWIHFVDDQIVLDISDEQQGAGPSTVRRTLASPDVEYAARRATRHLCEYVLEHKRASQGSQTMYRRLEQTESNAVTASAYLGEPFDLVRGHTVSMCAFPDYAPWLIGVTQSIEQCLARRGATVQVDLLESTAINRPTPTSDLDILLISARASERNYGPYRAREVSVAYRVTPRGTWETGNSLGGVNGVVDECYISYWPNPPLPSLPNTVESHSVRPVIKAVDQVLRQIQLSKREQLSLAVADDADVSVLQRPAKSKAEELLSNDSTQTDHMRYADDAGFSFELPGKWRRLANYTSLNLASEGSHIQIKVDPILPRFASRQSRIDSLLEPGASVVNATLGGESNSVILVNAVTGVGAISAVRSNTHYFVGFTNWHSEHVQRALQMLIRTFRYPE